MSRRDDRVCLIAAILCSLIVNRSVYALQKTDAGDFRERINAVKTENDPEGLRQLITDVKEKGNENRDANYYRTVAELCEALYSSTKPDRDRAAIAGQLAADALDSTGDRPLDVEVRLLPFTRYDPYYSKGLQRDADWQKERLHRLQRWLATWQRLQAAKKSLPSMSGDVTVTDDPGVDLEEIKDPVLRKKYENERAKNAQISLVNMQRRVIEYLESQFQYPAKCYIVEAYSEPPFDTVELEEALKGSELGMKFRAEIIDEVKKQVAARVVHREKPPDKPAAVPVTELQPPGTAVYQSDPRLRKTVTFNIASPKVEQLLKKLREETGVSLTRAGDVQNEYPAAGSLSYVGIPAWRVMDRMAALKYVEGRWESADDGYRLVRNGNPVAIPKSNQLAQVGPWLGWQRTVRVVGLLVTTAIIVVLIFLLIRRKRLATS